MNDLPASLAIGLWVTGTLWLLAIVAYFLGASTEWLLPLFMFGVLTGIAEWILRRMPPN